MVHPSYREINATDLEQIERLVAKTWDSRELKENPKLGIRLARAYLYACLARHSYSRIAVVNGRIAGLLLGRHNGSPARFGRLRWRLRSLWNRWLLLSSRRGIDNQLSDLEISQMDHQLLRNCHMHFDGELILFLVSDECRGLGIGHSLLQDFDCYMRAAGAEEYFVFTDTSCNVEFYEHHGFVRLGEIEYRPAFSGDDWSGTFYLYGYSLAKPSPSSELPGGKPPVRVNA